MTRIKQDEKDVYDIPPKQEKLWVVLQLINKL